MVLDGARSAAPAIALFFFVTPLTAAAASSGALSFAGQAGAASGPVVAQPVMGDPLPDLTSEELERFEIGRILFDTDLTIDQGLGPIFNETRCGACHNNPLGGSGDKTVTRFGRTKKGGFDPLAEFGGSLLQSEAISDECREQVPPEANVQAFRVTNGAFGYGLIEAIPDADIEANETNPPPAVSGRVHWVPAFEDPKGSPLRAGRFGWKAQVATILTFSADAGLNEMGLTNRFILEENDPNGVRPPDLEDCDAVPDPEDNTDLGQGMEFIDRVTDFQRFLAPPPQTPKFGMTGEQHFIDIGCADCHVPSFVTRDDPELEAALRNQTIQPYSDFLLHNMGLLGDGISQGDAGVSEFRTPPLWAVRQRDPILHDGRFGAGTFAQRIIDTVDAHRMPFSEAEDAANNFFFDLTGDEQDQLIAFLDSLGRAEFDHDGDNDRDVFDFNEFRLCYLIEVVISPDHPCAVSDVDQDTDVDDADFDVFLTVYDGELLDCNDNGVVDLRDILIGTSADENGNGIPDECEDCPADLDGNGGVDSADLAILLGAWGDNPGHPADIDGNGAVDSTDLALLLGQWGECD